MQPSGNDRDRPNSHDGRDSARTGPSTSGPPSDSENVGDFEPVREIESADGPTFEGHAIGDFATDDVQPEHFESLDDVEEGGDDVVDDVVEDTEGAVNRGRLESPAPDVSSQGFPLAKADASGSDWESSAGPFDSPWGDEDSLAAFSSDLHDLVLWPVEEHSIDTAPVRPPTAAVVAGVVVSVALHVWLLAILASWILDQRTIVDVTSVLTRFTDPVPEEDPVIPAEFELAPPDERELEVRKAITARSTGLALTKTPELRSPPQPLLDVALPNPSPVMYDIPEGVELDERIVIKGTTGEATMHIESALDRVTWEVASHLRERKVFLIWLIDASGSLEEQRLAIARRLKRVYGELGALDASGQIVAKAQEALLTGVVAFGDQVVPLTAEPTADFDAVLASMASLRKDVTGRENVFGAYNQILKKWGHYRTDQHRSILTVIVTDETGDDFANLEPALGTAKRFGAKAYVIGPTAVFGRREGLVPYVHPQDGKTYQLTVDLGPESFVVESVHLPFWFGGQQYEYLSSGLGPYALSRLVSETGGVYFLTNMTTMKGLSPTGVFTAQDMKAFAPDYAFGTPERYLEDAARHPLRRAVVAAAQLSLKHKAGNTPPLELRVAPENYLRTLNEAQKSAAETTYVLDTILAAFPNNMEAEYKKERSPRWRANYNLTLGRLLALKTRAFEYNSACAQLKQLGTGDVATKSNHWSFRPEREYSGGAAAKKMANEAERLLKRCIEEAPGTPWAFLAQRELSAPLGIKVVQTFDPPPKPQPQPPPSAAPANKQVRLAPDPKKPAPPPPKPAPPPVLPKL